MSTRLLVEKSERNSEEYLLQCSVVHHDFHVKSPGIKPKDPGWIASVQPPELWHDMFTIIVLNYFFKWQFLSSFHPSNPVQVSPLQLQWMASSHVRLHSRTNFSFHYFRQAGHGSQRSKECIVLSRSEAGIVGSNPTQDMDVWFVRAFFCVCVVLCIGRGLVTSWSPVQVVLPSVNVQETEKSALCSEVGASSQMGPRGKKNFRQKLRIHSLSLRCIFYI
jgi:hypothetical protein